MESVLSGNMSSNLNKTRTRFGLDEISQSGASFSDAQQAVSEKQIQRLIPSTGSPDIQTDLNLKYRQYVATRTKAQLLFLRKNTGGTVSPTEILIIETRLRDFFDWKPTGITTKVILPEQIVVSRQVTELQQRVFNNWIRQRHESISKAYQDRITIRKITDKTTNLYRRAVGTYNSNKASFYNHISTARNSGNYLIKLEAGRIFKTRPYPSL